MTHTLQTDEMRGDGRKGGILRRVLNSISEWDRTQADREIGRMLTRSGGRLTDDIERRMLQRATASSWDLQR